MTTYIDPLNLQSILVNTLAGSWFIFAAMAFIIITFLAAKFRMNNITFLMMFALFGIMMGFWINWLYAIVVMIGGMIISYVVAKLIKN